MALETFAIVIGVSSYEDSMLEDLPAARSDAVSFAQALRNWGISESNIALYLDEGAGSKQIDEVFASLKERADPFKLVFYFCGHGTREVTISSKPKSFLLLDKAKLDLEELLVKINRLNAIETYLFIDACHLRINSLVNPELEREILNQKGLDKSLFCILSSGIEQSFEDVEGEYGYFTRSLLKGLSGVRQGNNSPTVLLEKICDDHKNEDLPLPEMYNFETLRIDFLPNLPNGEGRLPLRAQIQDLLVEYPEKILCLIGEKGVGKTKLSMQFASDHFEVFYKKDPLALWDIPSYGLVFLDLSPSRDLDSLENLVIALLKKKGRFVLLCRRSFKNKLDMRLRHFVHDFELQPPKVEEIDKHLWPSQLDPNSKELIHLMAGGNPQKIQQMVESYTLDSGSDYDQEEVKRAIGAIVACGSYLDEDLFSRVYQLKGQTLAFIERMGLLYSTKKGWVPHECLFDIAESESLPIDGSLALEYWSQQMLEAPSDLNVAKSLILAMNCFGFAKELDSILLKALTILEKSKEEHFEFFDAAVEVFLSYGKVSETALFLVDILMVLGKIEQAEALLALPVNQSSMVIDVKIRKGQCLWRRGAFRESKEELTLLIHLLPEGSKKFQCLLSRGSSSFFIGDWEEAARDFSHVIKRSDSPQFVAWANCMIGSILGLRGIDKERGRKHLELGIRMLTMKEDVSGAWVGWNNLGELLWKMGEFRASAFHLQKALEVANNPSMKIETLRNLLELNLRKEGPNAKQTTLLLDDIENHPLESLESYEKMQVFNTLGFAFTVRGELKKAQFFLKKAIPLTASNGEHHLFTLANLSFLFQAYGLTWKSQVYLARSYSYGRERKHLLALDLIRKNRELIEEYQLKRILQN